jgi:hypothetical protein
MLRLSRRQVILSMRKLHIDSALEWESFRLRPVVKIPSDIRGGVVIYGRVYAATALRKWVGEYVKVVAVNKSDTALILDEFDNELCEADVVPDLEMEC